MSDWSTIISCVTAVVALVGAVVAFMQWRDAKKIERANRLCEIISLLRTDKGIMRVMYYIEYNKTWYTEDFHDSKDSIERDVDRAFSYISYYCYLIDQKILNEDEVKLFKYNIYQVLRNGDSIKYLYNVYHWANKNEVPSPFLHLCEYGRKIGHIDESFYDSNAWKKYPDKYCCYLNF